MNQKCVNPGKSLLKITKFLHGESGCGGVEQTFSTTKGQRYRVTFSLAGAPGCQFPVQRMALSAARKSQGVFVRFDREDRLQYGLGGEGMGI